MSRANGFARKGAAPATNVTAVADDEVRAILEREMAIKDELNSLRNSMRKLQDERESVLRREQPKQDKENASLSKEFDALMAKKSKLHAEMDTVKIRDNRLGQRQDELRLLEFNGAPLNKAIAQAENQVTKHKNRIRELQTQHESMKARLALGSVAEADAEMASLDKRLAALTTGKDNAQITALQKQRAHAERAKREVLQVHDVDEKIVKEGERLQKAENDLAEKREEKANTDARYKALKESLAESKEKEENRNTFNEVRAELRKVQEELDKLRDKRKKQSSAHTDPTADVVKQLVSDRERRDELQKELEKVSASIPSLTVPYEVELRPDLIGLQGATIAQLQKDFGVAIRVDAGKEGEMVLIGGRSDMENASHAITDMLERIAANRQKGSVKFDPKMARELIGPGGSNIDRLQSQSGAKLRLNGDEGIVHITGSREAVDTATKLIQDVIDSAHTAEIKFDLDIFEYLVGKGGKIVRAMTEETGAKNISINKDKRLITITGAKDKVEVAFKKYSDLIASLTDNSFKMRLDPRMTSQVIGKGGKTIRELEETTKAIIVVRNDTLTIRGPKESVQAARKMVEELVRREEVKIPFDAHIFNTLITRPLEIEKEVDEDGNEVRGQEVEKPTPLEEIKLDCQCDQVSAIRRENQIVIRGKRDCVRKAKLKVEMLLRGLKPDVIAVKVPGVLFARFTRRDSANRTSMLDELRLKNAGIDDISVDRDTYTITIVGGKESTASVAQELQAELDECMKTLRKIKIRDYQIGTIIGPQGKTISDLQRKTKTDVRVNREDSEIELFAQDEAALNDAEAEIKALLGIGKGSPTTKDEPAPAEAEEI